MEVLPLLVGGLIVAWLAAAGLLGAAVLVAHRLQRRDNLLRAGDSERQARLDHQLTELARAGRHDDVVRLIEGSMRARHYRPLRATLVRGAGELFQLEESVALARRAGVPAAITDRVRHNIDVAGDVLWSAADRAAAAAAQELDSARVRNAIRREQEKVARLNRAIMEAREGLVELTLKGGGAEAGYEHTEMQLKALDSAAQDLLEAP